jgi:hypothetical protein
MSEIIGRAVPESIVSVQGDIFEMSGSTHYSKPIIFGENYVLKILLPVRVKRGLQTFIHGHGFQETGNSKHVINLGRCVA